MADLWLGRVKEGGGRGGQLLILDGVRIAILTQIIRFSGPCCRRFAFELGA